MIGLSPKYQSEIRHMRRIACLYSSSRFMPLSSKTFLMVTCLILCPPELRHPSLSPTFSLPLSSIQACLCSIRFAEPFTTSRHQQLRNLFAPEINFPTYLQSQHHSEVAKKFKTFCSWKSQAMEPAPFPSPQS